MYKSCKDECYKWSKCLLLTVHALFACRSASLLKGGVNHFKQDTVSFVKQLVNKFTSPFLRFSFITFNDHANVVMPLTSDK